MSDTKPVTLTRTERLILSNQYRILEALYPNEKDHLARTRRVLEEGYELEYGWRMEHVYAKTLSVDDCRFVLDVLDMYRAIQLAHETHGSAAGVSQEQTLFPGFDGNNETALMGYAEHVRSDKRFDRVQTANNSLNAHMPTIGRYRAMLRVWETAADKHRLTQEELVNVLAAR